MKANEFFKKHGWNDTKVMIESPFGLGEYEYLWDDLKRLVESHELIRKDFESVEMAEYEYMISASYNESYWVRVKQAIADVESCMEVSSESN